jgi:hypothetical protein
MKIAIIFCLFGAAIADLRQASQPKQAYNLKQQGGGRGAKNFAVGTGSKVDGNTDGQAKGKVLYMEPSIFGYGGLANQRKKNYDNFLRSNIDNEQDNRNFNNEVGKDHLPFRTYDSATIASYPYKGTKAQGAADSLQVNIPPVATVLRALPGEPKLTPLRWNNPHASEIEVNLWIMCSDPPTIVPVKKPTCSGEGNQNNIIEWSIPSDFNNVAWNNCPSTACFNGCNNPGDCVLQTYAHSVETRQYSTAVPIIIPKQGTWTGKKLAYNAVPKDANEAKNFAWPSNFDLLSMVKGTKTQPPPRSNLPGASINNVEICASSEREGISTNGDAVAYVKLGNDGAPAQQLNAGTVNLYLCKNTDAERAAEQLVDQVVFTIFSSATGTGTFSPAGSRTENYTPFEMSSENQFGGAAVKKITAKITPYSGTPVTIVKLLDLRGNGKRWRFRRHLQAVCGNGLPKAFPDPWMDLSKLKRETCLSAQDPNSNYAKTQIQAAVLHSDVANHAYQNSNYSPYSGQQHGEISRNLQAAAVVHMTSGNRGELGKNAIPRAQKQTLKALNKAVNKIYKNYEKVANKVIDTVTNNGGKNGNGVTMGVQQLGTSFRSLEKGATSTKRLKTTTYVPSFDAAGYNMNTIQNAIASRTGGSKAKYKDLLSTPKPNTGKQYIEIYTATMNQMLPAFKAAEAKGISYMESVKMVPCSQIKDQNLKTLSTGTGRQATACCTGSLQNTAEGGCGATLSQKTQFKKRNVQNKADGGLYSGREFILNRYMTQYSCPRACMHPITQQKNANSGLLAAVTKTSTGTCVNYLSNAGCTTQKNSDYTDCTKCAGIFNNVAPASFQSDFQSGKPDGNLGKLISRLNSAPSDEPLGNVLNAGGEDLGLDNTAVCHTASKFTCPGAEKDYENEVNTGKCKEVESTKVDKMCDDGPCDNDENSDACKLAKAKCEVDPETGSMCMPGNENDPCADCIRTVSSGNAVALAFTTLFVGLASTML